MELEICRREPAKNQGLPTILFVHGMCHAAWCWEEHYLQYFADHGYPVWALSLRGHGSSEGNLRKATLGGYVKDVANTVKKIGSPVVLIGHSMGGLIVQKYLRRHKVSAAVLFASTPPFGVLPAVLKLFRDSPGLFLYATIKCQTKVVVEKLERAQKYLFSPELDAQLAQRYFEKLQNESQLAYSQMLIPIIHPKPLPTPLLVLGAGNDAFISASDIDKTAKSYQAPSHIFPGLSHDMMLDPQWKTVADYIIQWLGNTI